MMVMGWLNTKAKIVGQIEDFLPIQQILHDLSETDMKNTSVLVDFMAMVRFTQKQFIAKTFQDLLDNVIYYAKRVCSQLYNLSSIVI